MNPHHSPKTDGPQIGVYQCFGAWTAAATVTGAPDQRFTPLPFHLSGRGVIMGLIHEGGAAQDKLVGAIQGGTGEFAEALGTFSQVPLTAARTGISPGTPIFHGILDLILPNLGPTELPRNK